MLLIARSPTDSVGGCGSTAVLGGLRLVLAAGVAEADTLESLLDTAVVSSLLAGCGDFAV